MQGVVKAYDPASGDGVIMCDTDMNDYELAPNALDGSIFRMLRQGQRVVFQLNDKKQAAQISMGSESDMKTPAFEDAQEQRDAAVECRRGACTGGCWG